ncbi:MAG: helix-hairpin-helix domain-containing protein, partial [Planctomycetaceae bacterium]
RDSGLRLSCLWNCATGQTCCPAQQRLLAASLAGTLVLLVVSTDDQRLQDATAQTHRPGIPGLRYQIDINQAKWVEWTPLTGIGEKLARRITRNRTQHGRFETIASLRRVPGIGLRTIERLRPWLVVNPTPKPEPSIPTPVLSGGG